MGPSRRWFEDRASMTEASRRDRTRDLDQDQDPHQGPGPTLTVIVMVLLTSQWWTQASAPVATTAGAVMEVSAVVVSEPSTSLVAVDEARAVRLGVVVRRLAAVTATAPGLLAARVALGAVCLAAARYRRVPTMTAIRMKNGALLWERRCVKSKVTPAQRFVSLNDRWLMLLLFLLWQDISIGSVPALRCAIGTAAS